MRARWIIQPLLAGALIAVGVHLIDISSDDRPPSQPGTPVKLVDVFRVTYTSGETEDIRRMYLHIYKDGTYVYHDSPSGPDYPGSRPIYVRGVSRVEKVQVEP